MKNKVTGIELAFIIFTVSLAQKLHALPCLLAGYVDESLWVSALINFAIDFLLLLIVLKILNEIKGASFYDVVINKFGKILGNFIIVVLILFLLVKTFIPFIEQKYSVSLTFYETQPSPFVYYPVYIVIFYVALKGLWSYAKSINIITFLLISGIVVVLLLSISAIELDRILPFFAVPFKQIANGSFKTALWFGDPLLLLFFSKHVDKEETINGKIITGYLLQILTYVIILVIFYAVFENIAVRQYFAPLKMSKYSVTLSNIGRFDYLATLLIITANVYAISLPLCIASNLLTQLLKSKNKYLAPLIITGVSGAVTYLLRFGFFKWLNLMQNYGIWFLLAMNYLIPLLLLIKKRGKKNERI